MKLTKKNHVWLIDLPGGDGDDGSQTAMVQGSIATSEVRAESPELRKRKAPSADNDNKYIFCTRYIIVIKESGSWTLMILLCYF